jgi:hypothetical protein
MNTHRYNGPNGEFELTPAADGKCYCTTCGRRMPKRLEVGAGSLTPKQLQMANAKTAKLLAKLAAHAALLGVPVNDLMRVSDTPEAAPLARVIRRRKGLAAIHNEASIVNSKKEAVDF